MIAAFLNVQAKSTMLPPADDMELIEDAKISAHQIYSYQQNNSATNEGIDRYEFVVTFVSYSLVC